MKFRLMISGLALAATMGHATFADAVRIAEHRQARIDALKAVIPQIEKQTGVDVELVEYPGPDKEYLSKLLTELSAGTGPDVFSLPSMGQVSDFATAGYLEDLTAVVHGSDAWPHLYQVAKDMTEIDSKTYVMPTQMAVQEFYYRKDLLEKAGISTDQPKSWDDLLDRAREIKRKTGAYGLLIPMGATWGGGSWIEGFRLMLATSSTPEILTDDGKFDLTSKGVGEVFSFYEKLIKDDLIPVDPLLGPDPWVIPKYEMFPAGKLMITTCGSWCYFGDFGPGSRNPIPDVADNVGTWMVPRHDGGDPEVLAGPNHPWAVNANAIDMAAANKVIAAMGSVDLAVSYSTATGNLPARNDVAASPEFQKLVPLPRIMDQLQSGTDIVTATGFTTVMEGINRATEALLLGNTDAAGAQKILVDYVKNGLGDDKVK